MTYDGHAGVSSVGQTGQKKTKTNNFSEVRLLNVFFSRQHLK